MVITVQYIFIIFSLIRHFIVCSSNKDNDWISLYVPYNSGGLRGNITFLQERPTGSVIISIHLTTLPTAIPQQFEWFINEFPVFYDLKTACTTNELGKTEHDMSRRHAPIQIPPIDGKLQTFTDSEITLYGEKSIWSKSVVLRNLNNSEQRACSNVFTTGPIKSAIAVFTTNLAGSVLFRENDRGDTMIFSNLFNTADEYKPASKHEWKILVTDILDTKRDKKCDYLQILLDPNNIDDNDCSNTNHKFCKMGDMTKKHGMITIGSNNNRYSKKFLIDTNFPLSYLGSSRGLYLVLYEKGSNKRVLSCAKLELIEPKEVKAIFNMDGVKGSILFSQSYRTDPTVVTVNLENLRGRGKWYHVHEFPIQPTQTQNDERCSAQSVGGHFNPFDVNAKLGPSAGIGTNDQYEVGDLSGKYGPLSEEQDLFKFLGIYVDMNLPLFGTNSIVGRSIVIHKGNGDRWICANIGYPGAIITAVANFFYPVVGRVIFRQQKDNPWDDTTVFAELSYSDGSINNTFNHMWRIHTNEPGRDFYNWTKRCESAGTHFNPFNVGMGRNYNSQCGSENPYRCEIGDLASKSKKLNIAAFKGSIDNKHFHTDIQLPLSGPNWLSIIGRSLVIHDELAPKQRGNRMACAMIRVMNPIIGAVRTWKTGSSITSNISGSIVFFQESEFDETTGKVDLHGLNSIASGYHVHEVWVPIDKEFPCSSDSVYGHFNPFKIDLAVGPSPKVGSVDQYEVGDLSGKFGTLDNKNMERMEFIDLNLPLHGQHSIIGRSVVIHKKEKNFRWVCGTVRAEVRKDKAREIIGLASFDSPRHLISGYIRLKQFEFIDGGMSDTWIEVDLRYPGLNNRNISYGHDWAVYVNQVGEDAFNLIDSVRCLASGYRWNPYLSKDDIESYKLHCNPSNPFHCAMGDLRGRHGSLAIGSQKRALTDVNLPLFGNFSVMGRSIIIFKKNGSNIPIACANIKPDIHLVRTVAIKKIPAFTVAKFMQHMRGLLNTSDWLVVADVSATKDILNDECVQLSVNFYGVDAHRLQIEFSNLINLGTIKRNTRLGLQSVSTYYKPCKTVNEINGCSQINRNLYFIIFYSYISTFLIIYIFKS